MAQDHDSKLERVRKLIAIASDENGNSAEREIAQRQAERLMVKYSIEEWELAKAGGREAGNLKPERKTGIVLCKVGHPCAFPLAHLAMGLASHMNVSLVFSGLDIKAKNLNWDVTITAMGYPEDLRVWEMIFTLVQLQLTGKIDPKVDPTKTFDENVYTLHAAGIKWLEISHRVNQAATAAGWKPVKWTEHGDGGRLKRASRRHAALIGEEYVSKSDPAAYQRSFASAFANTVLNRFAAARTKESTTGTALVLRDKMTAVMEYRDELYPELGTADDPYGNRKLSAEGWQNGTKAGREADLSLDPKMGATESKALS